MTRGNSENCLIPTAARGLRVLLADEDTSSLIYMASVLEEQFYNVRTTGLASVAVSMIHEGDDQFDLVMADTNMREMDIFTFLNHIQVKRDIPIIFMSVDENMDMARKALSEGACFFLQKPIRRRDIINVWQHVFRKRTISQEIPSRKEAIGKKVVPRKDSCAQKIIMVDSLCRIANENLPTDGRGDSSIMEDEGGFGRVWGKQTRELPHKAWIMNVEKGNQGASCREIVSDDSYGGRRNEERSDHRERSDFDDLICIEDGSERKDSDNGSPERRLRMKWTPSLHRKFVEAISELEDRKAHPISVLRMMNEPSLTARHIASHLQKYRDRVNQINSAADSPVFQPNVVGTPYNFYGANGFIEGMLDRHDSVMHTQGVFNDPHCQIGAATTDFTPPLSLPFSPELNNGAPVHYTIKSLQQALKSDYLRRKRNSSLCPDNMFNGSVQAAAGGNLVHRLSGLIVAGPNAGQKDDHDQLKLLGFDRNIQNFTYLSPEPDYSMEWTDVCQSLELLPDVSQYELDPFDQDLNPPPQNNLQKANQSAQYITSFFQGHSGSSGSDLILSNFPKDCQATNLDLNHKTPRSFTNMVKLVEGDQGPNGEPEIGDLDIERYLEWFVSPPDSGNEFL